MHDDAFDIVITDLSLPDARGLGAVLRIRDCAPEAMLLVCSSVADEASALRVIELGAQDFEPSLALAADPGKANSAPQHLRIERVLTGLWNRAAFDERLDQALAQARRHPARLAVMYIDLDGFKAIDARNVR